MSDSRWLDELSKAYVAESVGQPANLNEELLEEQENYISLLENMLMIVSEELNVDLDVLAEAAKKPAAPKKSLTTQQLKALGMTRSSVRSAEAGTGGGAKGAKLRAGAVKKLESLAASRNPAVRKALQMASEGWSAQGTAVHQAGKQPSYVNKKKSGESKKSSSGESGESK